MSELRDDEASVTFPATTEFARVGRVTASGLALRLGFEGGKGEHLRLAVDAAVNALLGQGTIALRAAWTDDHLELSLENPDADLSQQRERLVEQLGELVPQVSVLGSTIFLAVG